ncbi:dirigent protein 22-like [Abrus precatorius]|uniref:Dirigent protein n=1 Tax=Abrus precatorius TaxID=3816 RepID=A0A8B8L8K6_ABRPR|nr:dirigent protein 22-like [Abrus precatorius]
MLGVMAKSRTPFSTFFIPLTLCVSILFSSHITAKASSYSRRISPASVGFHEEKLSHLHFYFHDIVIGPNRTSVTVAEPLKGKSNSSLPFGTVVTIENQLTVGPEPESESVGKAQGLYVSSSREGPEMEAGLTMAMTFAFTEGKYKGSSLSVLGRNVINYPVREMPILGGTGDFRFARGFAQAKTHAFDHTTGDAIEEYDVFVFHYLPSTSPSVNFHQEL